ncbi:MAG: hypothetical protein P8Y00_07450, partial [Deltaproteobacteria bacterium]
QGISVREFTWRFENDQMLSVQGTLPVNILRKPFLRPGPLFLDQMKLESSTGAARIDGTLSWKGASDLQVVLANVKSGKWLPPRVADHLRFDGLNARIRISGTRETPAVTVAGDVAHLESNDAGLSLSGHFNLIYGKQGISVRELTRNIRPRVYLAI